MTYFVYINSGFYSVQKSSHMMWMENCHTGRNRSIVLGENIKEDINELIIMLHQMTTPFKEQHRVFLVM